MRVQLVLLSLCLSLNVFADTNEAEMKDLFKKYDQVMALQSDDTDSVFTKSFMEESGGKDAFLKKIKNLVQPKANEAVEKELNIKPAQRTDMFFVGRTPKVIQKSKKKSHGGSQFIVIREDNKLKIDGTLSDGE